MFREAIQQFRRHPTFQILELCLHLVIIYQIFFRSFILGSSVLIFWIFWSVALWALLRIFKNRALGIFLSLWPLLMTGGYFHIDPAQIALYLGSWAPPILGQSGFFLDQPMIGLSYLSFRWILLSLEMTDRSGAPQHANFLAGLSYLFYAPLFLAGPISKPKNFLIEQQMGRIPTKAEVSEAMLRSLWGLTKFFPLASLFYQMTLTRQLVETQSLSFVGLIFGVAAYPIFLFLNFSGFNDIMIAISLLMGRRIDENFNRPYLAISLKDFWNRWHMTLTHLLRILIFQPVLRIFIFKTPRFSSLALYCIATAAVFVAMALWHGPTWNYLVFGLIQIVGLSIEELYKETFTKKPTQGLESWIRKAWVYFWVALGFFFFENSPSQIEKIMNIF